MGDTDPAGDRARQERAFLVSLAIHVALIIVLLPMKTLRVMPQIATPPSATPTAPRVRLDLPPPEALRRLMRVVPRRAPPPPALASSARDRISIGGPAAARARVLVLSRDQEITKEPAGDGRGGAASPDARDVRKQRPSSQNANARVEEFMGGDDGLEIPPSSLSDDHRGGLSAGEGNRSIASSFRRWQHDLQGGRWDKGEGGGGRQMGPLFFDPAGADFTSWINHFKNEVYRNWIVPQGALIGFKGRVEFRFTVGRDGRMTELILLRSSETSFLDRAAANALLGSRFLPLPDDYQPDKISMIVAFFYNEDPRSS